jgi:hypothetical protein
MNRLLRAGAVVLGLVWAGAAFSAQQSQPVVPPEYERSGGPYVPTPNRVVDQMLKLAQVGARDHVIDLGSGDGIIVLTAAHQLKASGYGVDIDEVLVQSSNQRAKNLGLADRVKFEVRDIFKADVSKATVVTLYLLPEMMRALLPKLFRELRPGTRIVSHDYHFDSWDHVETVTFDAPEKEMITGVPQATLYLWVVPAKVAGTWRVSPEGAVEQTMTLRQNYNGFDGDMRQGGRTEKLTDTEVGSQDIRFVRNDGNGRQVYRGRVDGNRMEGTVELRGGKTVRWQAVRQTS